MLRLVPFIFLAETFIKTSFLLGRVDSASGTAIRQFRGYIIPFPFLFIFQEVPFTEGR